MLGNMPRVVLSEAARHWHPIGCVNLCTKHSCAKEAVHMRIPKQRAGMTAHQSLLLEMLKDIDTVCRKHRISYQLFAGTALGAVRHHGFIPWDDDADIIMPRREYTRFFRKQPAILTRRCILFNRNTVRIGRCHTPSCGGTTRPA